MKNTGLAALKLSLMLFLICGCFGNVAMAGWESFDVKKRYMFSNKDIDKLFSADCTLEIEVEYETVGCGGSSREYKNHAIVTKVGCDIYSDPLKKAEIYESCFMNGIGWCPVNGNHIDLLSEMGSSGRSDLHYSPQKNNWSIYYDIPNVDISTKLLQKSFFKTQVTKSPGQYDMDPPLWAAYRDLMIHYNLFMQGGTLNSLSNLIAEANESGKSIFQFFFDYVDKAGDGPNMAILTSAIKFSVEKLIESEARKKIRQSLKNQAKEYLPALAAALQFIFRQIYTNEWNGGIFEVHGSKKENQKPVYKTFSGDTVFLAQRVRLGPYLNLKNGNFTIVGDEVEIGGNVVISNSAVTIRGGEEESLPSILNFTPVTYLDSGTLTPQPHDPFYMPLFDYLSD